MFGDSFFKRVEKKTNINKETIFFILIDYIYM